MYPLGALITRRMELNDWSLDAVVARAVKQKEKLGRANLDKLKKVPPEVLSRKTLFGLAAGLGVTPLTVANAVLESWRIEPLAVEVTDTLSTVKIDPSLSERNRRELVALIREMRSVSEPKARRNLGLHGQNAGMDGRQQRRKRHSL